MTIAEIVTKRDDNARCIRNTIELLKSCIHRKDFRQAADECDTLRQHIEDGRRISDALSVRVIDTTEDS